MQSNETKFTRGLVAGSFLVSAGLALWLTLNDLGWAIGFLAFSLAAAGSWFFIPYRKRNNKATEWLLTVAILNLLLAVPELALRAGNFRYESGIQFGWPRPSDFSRLESDEKLFWKRKSSDQNINSEGFSGEEVTVPKPDNAFRILFLGDSVTEQGYPQLVEERLNQRMATSAKRFESVNLGVAGYSSHQGQILAQTYGSVYEPDLVFVYFGWNDHWLAYGSPDADKKVQISNGWLSQASRVAYRNLRLFQSLNWLKSRFAGVERPISEVRVSIRQYRKNLRRIQEIFDKESAPVVFITAPTSHYSLGVPDYIVNANFVPDKRSAVTWHREYNEAVREITGTGGGLLLDLETEFKSAKKKQLRRAFMSDGIHLTEVGLTILTRKVCDFIESESLLDSKLETTFSTKWDGQPVPGGNGK